MLTGAAALSAAAILPRASLGADWRPTETVRLIVPAAPGGTTDVMGRLLAAHLQTAWGQSAVVENRSGGGGTIGTAEVVRQKGDGHTILVGNPGPNAIAYSIFRNMTYKADAVAAGQQPDPDSEHRVGASVVPIKSIAELIAYIKANPDKLTYGSSGVGQSPHLTGAWFLQLTGLKMVHVPFRGAGPALQAALGGDIQILFDNLYPTLPQVQDGKLNALAVTTTERSRAGAQHSDHARERAGAGEVRRLVLVRHFPAEERARARASMRSTRKSRCSWSARTSRRTSAKIGARTDYGTPQQFSDFVAGGDREVRRHHQAGRPADGRG